MIAPFCPLPLTDKRRAYVSSHHTDIRKTLEEHAPIRVSEVARIKHEHANFGHKHARFGYGDDYDLVERTSHLDMIGEFAR